MRKYLSECATWGNYHVSISIFLDQIFYFSNLCAGIVLYIERIMYNNSLCWFFRGAQQFKLHNQTRVTDCLAFPFVQCCFFVQQSWLLHCEVLEGKNQSCVSFLPPSQKQEHGEWLTKVPTITSLSQKDPHSIQEKCFQLPFSLHNSTVEPPAGKGNGEVQLSFSKVL